MRRIILLLALTLTVSGCGGTLAVEPASFPAAAAPTNSTLPLEADSVKFAVIGDSGTGDTAQYEIAYRLTEARERFPFEFVLMLGDNLYGSEGPSAYVSRFERPFGPLLEQGVEFYASLGNHDEPAQRLYQHFNMGGERFYAFRKDDVEFFVLDSTYMSPQQLEWFEGAVSGSDAPWKIAYMHHPIYSSGDRHGPSLTLREQIEPLLLAHGVDVVFAGHEHFYERMAPQRGIHYVIQGGSAKLRRGDIEPTPLTLAGFDADRSFTLVEIVGDHLFIETVSRTGAIVDTAVLPRRELNAVTTN